MDGWMIGDMDHPLCRLLKMADALVLLLLLQCLALLVCVRKEWPIDDGRCIYESS